MFASLACVATMILRIPSPLGGFINLGDCIVLLCGWLLSPLYGLLAAGIGSALADIFSGYVFYAPATFVIKALMALVAGKTAAALSKKTKPLFSNILSGLLAECIMLSGYYVFEGFVYGFAPSLVNIPANAIQGAVGLVLGCILVQFFKNNKILHK